MPREKRPELTFQQHVADYLVREHGYGVLEQSDITDTEHFIAEDHLWALLKVTQADTPQNRITFRPHFHYRAEASSPAVGSGVPPPAQGQKEIDFVLFLNGLPIVALKLKHEKNQNVHDAVAQFAARDLEHKIFSPSFLYLATDTSDVMAATDPRREENFLWHNMGLVNTPTNPNEYPVEFLYREVLSQEQLLEALSFFLVRVPKREAEGDKPERPAFTIFPRYHQARLERKVAEDVTAHFSKDGNIGRKYLAEHSPGSDKTLSSCWLADRLRSLYQPGTNEKLVDITFILTDRTALDDHIRREIVNYTDLKDVVGLADRADDLPRFLKPRKPIIVTTHQELLAVLLGSGTTSIDVMTLAEKLTAVVDEEGLNLRAEDLIQLLGGREL